jgi:hypothetical protein
MRFRNPKSQDPTALDSKILDSSSFLAERHLELERTIGPLPLLLSALSLCAAPSQVLNGTMGFPIRSEHQPGGHGVGTGETGILQQPFERPAHTGYAVTGSSPLAEVNVKATDAGRISPTVTLNAVLGFPLGEILPPGGRIMVRDYLVHHVHCGFGQLRVRRRKVFAHPRFSHFAKCAHRLPSLC